jgi:hypothetical protein
LTTIWARKITGTSCSNIATALRQSRWKDQDEQTDGDRS